MNEDSVVIQDSNPGPPNIDRLMTESKTEASELKQLGSARKLGMNSEA